MNRNGESLDCQAAASGPERRRPSKAPAAPPNERTSPPESRRKRPVSCMDRALKLLGMRDHGEAELRRKLAAAGHGSEEIDAAFVRLRELGYLDDERFALARARQLADGGRTGMSMAVRKLRMAGIGADLASRAAAEAFSATDELARARALASKRYPGVTRASDQKDRARVARFLAGRGFSPSVICKVLSLDDAGEGT